MWRLLPCPVLHLLPEMLCHPLRYTFLKLIQFRLIAGVITVHNVLSSLNPSIGVILFCLRLKKCLIMVSSKLRTDPQYPEPLS